MDNKRLLAEVDVLKQIMPSACPNIIELGGRYLAASGKLPVVLSVDDMDVLNDLLLSLRNHLDRATEGVDIKRTSNRIKALESIIHAVMKKEKRCRENILTGVK